MADTNEIYNGTPTADQKGGDWQSNFVADLWRAPDTGAQVDAEPFKAPATGLEAPAAPFHSTEDPNTNGIAEADETVFSNGDTLSIGKSGGWEVIDKEGNPVTEVGRIDEGSIPGSTSTLLSNGAILHEGSYTNSITYPNGDAVSWFRNGEVLRKRLSESEGGADETNGEKGKDGFKEKIGRELDEADRKKEVDGFNEKIESELGQTNRKNEEGGFKEKIERELGQTNRKNEEDGFKEKIESELGQTNRKNGKDRADEKTELETKSKLGSSIDANGEVEHCDAHHKMKPGTIEDNEPTRERVAHEEQREIKRVWLF